MAFKACSSCGRHWRDRDVFLGDPEVTLVGYQVMLEDLEAGYFLFNHTRPGCGSTVSIRAGLFLDLYEGPMFLDRKAGTAECSGQCLHTDDLRPCPVQCECAFVREVLDRVRHWPKPGVGPVVSRAG